MRRQLMVWGVAGALFALDQFTKSLVVGSVSGPVTVIPGFFDLVNIRNRGAAFGFLNRGDIEWQFWLFLAAALLAVVIIVHLARQTRNQPWLLFALGLILGGALGNLYDRLRYRAVVDFLDFYWRDWHWPAFNVADMGICIGAALACLCIWHRDRSLRAGEKRA